MTKLIGFCGCVALLICAGCIAVPIHTPEKLVAGSEITQEQLRFIEPGSTRRDDVIRQFGEPYAELADLRMLVYRWEMHTGTLLWGIAGTGAGTGGTTDMYTYNLLLIAFDADERVVQFEKTTLRWPWTHIREHARRWAEEHELAVAKTSQMPTPGSILEEESVLFVYRTDKFRDNPDVGRPPWEIRVNRKVVGWLRKGEYLGVKVAPGAQAVTIDSVPRESFKRMMRVPYETFASVDVQAVAGQARYVEALVPKMDVASPALMLHSEEEALPVLKQITPSP